MKRMLIVGVLLLLCTLSAYSTDTIKIANATDLSSVRIHKDKHYVLTSDITLSVSPPWDPIGIATDPFTGSFNGAGHKITGLYINSPQSAGVGLFGYISGAEIGSLTVESYSVTGHTGVGILAGVSAGSTIKNCHVKGVVTGDGSVGGLIGSTEYGTGYPSIEGCSADVAVTGSGNVGGLIGYHSYGNIDYGCHTSGTVSGTEYVGGLVGFSYGNIFRSYSSASVTCRLIESGSDASRSGMRAGGLVGQSGGTVYLCHASGSVSGYDFIGGLVGINEVSWEGDNVYWGFIDECYAVGAVSRAGGTTHENFGGLFGRNEGAVSRSYYDNTVTSWSGGGNTEGVTGKSTTEMYRQDTYVNWEWNEWSINGAYPYLTRYENLPPPVVTPAPIDTVITITSQPSPLTLVYGDAGLLRVVAGVSPADVTLSYQWYCTDMTGADIPLSNATTADYNLSRPPAGTYYYHCVISAGTVTRRTSDALVQINKHDLHVRVCDTSRVYGEPNPASYRLTYAGFIADEDTNSLTTRPVASCAATLSSPVGTYPITISGGISNNYTIIPYQGTLTVTPAPDPDPDPAPDPDPEPEPEPEPELVDTVITITTDPSSFQTLVYGSTPTPLRVDASVDHADADDLRYQWYNASNDSAISDATAKTYTPSVANAGTYCYYCVVSIPGSSVTPDTSIVARVEITKRALSIGVSDTFRVYNTPDPVFRLVYAGFIGSDNATTSLDSVPRVINSISRDRPVTSYPNALSVSQTTAHNYSISYAPGTLTILPAVLTGSNFFIDTTFRPMQVVPTAETIGIGAVTIYYSGKSPTDLPGTYRITIDVTSGINYAAASGLYVGTYTIPTLPVNPDPVDPVDPVDPDKPKPVDPVDPKPIDPVDPSPSDPDADDSSISVWLPSVSGLSTLPVSGRYPLTLGATFTFTISLPSPSSSVSVSTSRSPSTDASRLVLLPSPQSLTVHILDVRESLTVSLRLDPPSSTGTFPPSPSSPLVWATPGYLHLSSSLPQLVQIYTLSGHLLHMFPLLGTVNTALPKGLYIVSTGNQQHKVFVR